MDLADDICRNDVVVRVDATIIPFNETLASPAL
jgi:hypothetical protein